jgi:hypothetical protein
MVNITQLKNLLKIYKEHNWIFEVDVETVHKDLKQPIIDMREIIKSHKETCNVIYEFKKSKNMLNIRTKHFENHCKSFEEIYNNILKKDEKALIEIKSLYDNQPTSS